MAKSLDIRYMDIDTNTIDINMDRPGGSMQAAGLHEALCQVNLLCMVTCFLVVSIFGHHNSVFERLRRPEC